MTPSTPSHPRRGIGTLLAAALLLPGLLLLPSGSAATTLYQDDFESGAAGWNATGLWSLNGDRAKSGNTSWHYGFSTAPGTADNHYNTTAPNGTATPNSGTLTSPAIALPNASTVLSFWTYWAGEGCPWEHPVVQVSANGTGGNFSTVHESCSSTGNSTFIEVSLAAYAGKTVHVRFLWDTKDAVANHHEGWYVDDVRIATLDPDVRAGSVKVASTGPLVAGDAVSFSGIVANGAAIATGVGWELRVDGLAIAGGTLDQMDPFRNATVYADWNATAGNHTLTLVVDPYGQLTESNESNNARSVSFYVYPGVADLTVDITGIRKMPILTDFGPVPFHPLQRQFVDMVVCNRGTVGADVVRVDMAAKGVSPHPNLATGAGPIGTFNVGPIAAGECKEISFTWAAYHTLGDVDVSASVATPLERVRDNNVDVERTFVVVGNLGGVVLPHAA